MFSFFGENAKLCQNYQSITIFGHFFLENQPLIFIIAKTIAKEFKFMQKTAKICKFSLKLTQFSNIFLSTFRKNAEMISAKMRKRNFWLQPQLQDQHRKNKSQMNLKLNTITSSNPPVYNRYPRFHLRLNIFIILSKNDEFLQGGYSELFGNCFSQLPRLH